MELFKVYMLWQAKDYMGLLKLLLERLDGTARGDALFVKVQDTIAGHVNGS